MCFGSKTSRCFYDESYINLNTLVIVKVPYPCKVI